MLCPFCKKDEMYRSDTNIYHCFSCGETVDETHLKLVKGEVINLPIEEADDIEDIKERLELNKKAANYFVTNKNKTTYFKERGLTDETILKFGLGYDDGGLHKVMKHPVLAKFDRDWFEGRAIFPIVNLRHEVIGFGSRLIEGEGAKYTNTSEDRAFVKSKTLYGLNYAVQSKHNYFILCEGYMDVISLHQAGFDNAVASLGTAFTPNHAQLIKMCNKEYGKQGVVLAYDSDEAGIKAYDKAKEILKTYNIPTKKLNLSPYKDPDEFLKNLSREELVKRIGE